MKKIVTVILILFGTLSILCICGISNLKGCNNDNEHSEPPIQTAYEIKFIIDGELFSTESALYGDILTAPPLDEKSGYVFKGWYTTQDYIYEWNFATDTVANDMSLFGYWVKIEEETFNVLFMDGDNLIESVKVKKDATVSEISLSEKGGYTFINWYDGENEYSFNEPVVKDLTLNAKWQLNVYSVSFIADEKLVEKINFTIENMQILAPEVPPKQYYSAEWEEYTLTLEDFEVCAIYTPIIYTATIVICELTNEIYYTVEDPLKLPEIPKKNGYTSNWDSIPPEGGNFTIKAIYTPITYYVSFKVGDDIIKKCEYTVENKNIIPPAVPHIDGYTGSWEQKDYETGDVTINAAYSLIIYTATFIIDNEIITTEYFYADKMFVSEPDIPERTGYSASWEEYILDYEDIEINAVYTPILYNAYLLVDNAIYDSTQFTIEDEFLNLPAVPEKQGYTAVWESYTINANDLFINAIYTPIIYFATFIAEGKQIAKIPFSVENNEITIPTPLKKSGYTVKWSNFVLAFEDVNVVAIYEEIAIEGGWDKSDNYEYEPQADGSIIIKKYNGSSKNPVIPSSLDGKPVKSIGAQAFMNSGIYAIRISDGIETIQRDAFLSCNNLTKIILPDSLKTIEQNAFASCAFTEIYLPENVTEIGTRAFYHSNLHSIKIPDNVKTLEDVFWYCENLENVTLGKNLQTIKSKSFFNCPSLERISIPCNVTLIEPGAFTNCNNLTEVHFEDPDNWTICNENNIQVQDLDMSNICDDSTAALWLTNIHIAHYWKKEKN